ncbi:phosphatase PAP2 family protein [Leifsonia sp. F6_8S_P_1B]|uniref:Phosphatase PAP2 family protein n=1 Tax=Leifsonia williamsii TaxID=3035919 RepID=A0ABT8KCX0_9MICO|nr:phosphatase PAP2 family protein [Leifsonia williamsii]MDN4615310.1 phosphatase PAP2 family protein [Leifsonia williamsii]
MAPRNTLATGTVRRLPQPRHWVLLSALGALAVLTLGFAVKLLPGVLGTELALDEELTDHQHTLLNIVGVVLSTVFSPVGAAVILAVSCTWLLLVRRAPMDALAFGGITAAGWLSPEVFKVLVGEPRPDAALLDHPLLAEAGHDSFPSGHTAFVAAYAIACWVLARGGRWERAAAVAGTLAVAVMAASRLYVSAHYLTDVIGSVLVALTAAIVFCGLWNRFAGRLLPRLAGARPLGPDPEARL